MRKDHEERQSQHPEETTDIRHGTTKDGGPSGARDSSPGQAQPGVGRFRMIEPRQGRQNSGKDERDFDFVFRPSRAFHQRSTNPGPRCAHPGLLSFDPSGVFMSLTHLFGWPDT
jgi:hypothetical protein